MEVKSIPLEFKDIDSSKRTGTIKHAVYNSTDRVDDISTKGMFTKSWQEHKAIDFLFNHKEDEIVGNVTGTFEDDNAAFTEVKFGKWKLGDDVIEMAEAKVLRGASFGYITQKKEFIQSGGKKVRKLKEVWHKETSLLTKMPAHPEAGLISLNKAFDGLELKSLSAAEQVMLKNILSNDLSALEQLVSLSSSLDVTSDLYTWINYNISRRADNIGDIRSQLKYNSAELSTMKSYVENVEKFCRESKASDECIKRLLQEVEETKELLSEYDTSTTRRNNEQGESRNDSFYKQLLLLNAKLN